MEGKIVLFSIVEHFWPFSLHEIKRIFSLIERMIKLTEDITHQNQTKVSFYIERKWVKVKSNSYKTKLKRKKRVSV